MPYRMNQSIALLMFAIAIIMAAGVFLAMNVIRNRNNNETAQEQTNNFPITVGSEQISLQVDPNTRPTIVEPVDNSPRPEDAPVETLTEATATPEATAVPATTEPPTAVPTAAVEKIIFQDYTVQPGDTLYSISQRIDTSIALMADKGISQANLTPGTIIKLPIGNPAYCTGKGRPYAVGEGDTAYNISQRFNTTAANLQTLNGLDANFTVKVADIICVP